MKNIKTIKNILKKNREDKFDTWAFDINSSDYKVGVEVFNFLNLKMEKSKNGLGNIIETAWGTKTIKGLGASIIRIVEENK